MWLRISIFSLPLCCTFIWTYLHMLIQNGRQSCLADWEFLMVIFLTSPSVINELFYTYLHGIFQRFRKRSCVVILCMCVFLVAVTLRRSPHGRILARPWQPAWIRWASMLRPAIIVAYRDAPWPCHSQTSVRNLHTHSNCFPLRI